MSASRARQLQEGDFATVQRITEGRTFPQQVPIALRLFWRLSSGTRTEPKLLFLEAGPYISTQALGVLIHADYPGCHLPVMTFIQNYGSCISECFDRDALGRSRFRESR